MEETVAYMLPPRALFLGSYPPRECGIATFTKDMVDAYDRAFGFRSPVIAIDEPGARSAPLSARSRRAHRASKIARAMRPPPSSSIAYPVDLVNIQHEYGLFGGERGEWLVDFLRGIDKAGRTDAAHRAARTRRDVSARHARALRARNAKSSRSRRPDEVCSNASTASIPEQFEVIHHGVPDVPFQDTDAAKASFGIGQRTVISTFGLISRGKGLEYAIEAMRGVVKRHPEALYLILGETHPGRAPARRRVVSRIAARDGARVRAAL